MVQKQETDGSTSMSSAPMVSVIVLTRNHAWCIEQCLCGILSQRTTFLIEILVGDDASTDGTSEILMRYAAQEPERMSIFIRERNIGATRNAYELFCRARGKYLAHCEGDDFWTAGDKLQKQVDFLESHPEYIGCTHNFETVDRKGHPIPVKLNWVSPKRHYTVRDFKGINLPGQAATWLHRNIFLNPVYDYSIYYRAHPMIGDRTLILLLCAQGDFYRLPEVMSCYRCVSGSATGREFMNNRNVNLMQYQFTCQLEEYARSVLKMKNIRFTRFKLEQLLKAKIKAIISKGRNCDV